jgi:hypothetical protein
MADNSVATQMEDWIVTQIRALKIGDDAVFDAEDVQPWEGGLAPNINQITAELFTGRRDLAARVFYHSDRTVDLEAGEIKVIPQYIVVIGMRNRRPQAARRGDDQAIGTNLLRDLLIAALHDKRPLDGEGELIGDAATAVDRTCFRGSRILVNQTDLCIQETTIEADEVPRAQG